METTLTTRGSIGSKRVPKLNMQELVSVVNQRYEKALVSMNGPMCLLQMFKHMRFLFLSVWQLLHFDLSYWQAAKALTRLRVGAVSSEPLMLAHT